MMSVNREMKNQRPASAGQTLIIAIIILGILLILGFAFASIISRNITESGRAARRTVAGDLSRAGVEYAHNQLLHGALGADWHPSATLPQIDGFGNTKDPDALYLRPGTGFMVVPNPARPTVQILDRGGPDYMGPYSRVNFDKGRALMRVRWAPSSFGAFAAPVRGGLRTPGLAKNYLIIESVGRPGNPVDTSGKVDPTKQFAQAVQVSGFVDQATLQAGIGNLRAQDAQITDSRRLIAFASIGIIETARFITNKHNVSRKAEIGFPSTVTGSPNWSDQTNAGVSYEGVGHRDSRNLSLGAPGGPPATKAVGRSSGGFGGAGGGGGSKLGEAGDMGHERQRAQSPESKIDPKLLKSSKAEHEVQVLLTKWSDDVLAALKKAGLTVDAKEPGLKVVFGRISAAKLKELAKIVEVDRIKPLDP